MPFLVVLVGCLKSPLFTSFLSHHTVFSQTIHLDPILLPSLFRLEHLYVSSPSVYKKWSPQLPLVFVDVMDKKIRKLKTAICG
jgi:hypothetical protein